MPLALELNARFFCIDYGTARRNGRVNNVYNHERGNDRFGPVPPLMLHPRPSAEQAAIELSAFDAGACGLNTPFCGSLSGAPAHRRPALMRLW